MAEKKFQEEALATHNKFRSHHGVGALALNPEICAIAQKWAEKMAAGNALKHSTPAERQYKGGQMGENIAMKHDSRIKAFGGASATKQWYSEIKDYDFGAHKGRGVVGHFTQVVWKDAKEFGIGRAQGKSGAWYVCANYFPAGNFMGRNPDNVRGASGGAALEVDSDDEIDENAAAVSAGGFGGFGDRRGFGGQGSLFSRMPMGGGGGGVSISKSTKTKTTTDASGKTVTVKVTTETRTEADGTSTTTTTEEIL